MERWILTSLSKNSPTSKVENLFDEAEQEVRQDMQREEETIIRNIHVKQNVPVCSMVFRSETC